MIACIIPCSRVGRLENSFGFARSGGHDNNDIGEESRLNDAVGHKHHGLMELLPDLNQPHLHIFPGLGIKGAEGLVHEEDFGSGKKGTSYIPPVKRKDE